MGSAVIKMTKSVFLKKSNKITKHEGVMEVPFAKILVSIVKRCFVSGSYVKENITVFRKKILQLLVPFGFERNHAAIPLCHRVSLLQVRFHFSIFF